MRLSSKTSLLIVSLGIVLYVPLSLIMVHFQERALRASAYGALDDVARNSALLVAQFAENAQLNVKLLAAAIPVQALPEKRLVSLKAQISNVFDVEEFENEIAILDGKGTVLLGYPEHPGAIGRSVADQDFFRETLATRRCATSLPHFSAGTGRPVVTFAAPVMDASGTILAVVACSYDLLAADALGRIQSQKLGRTGYVFMFDQTRMMVVHPDPKRVLQRDIPVGANLFLDQAIGGFEGTCEGVSSRGVSMLESFHRVPGTTWIIGAQIPLAEAYEAIASLRRIMLAATIVSVLFLLGVGVWMVNLFSLPLRYLHMAARAITLELQGVNVDWDVIPLLNSIRTKDETGALARTFVDLVERQRQSLGLLRRAAAEWERTFDAVKEAILCLDAGGNIMRINREAALWFRVAPDAVLGLAGRTLVLGEDDPSAYWPEVNLLDASHVQTWTGGLPGREGRFEFQALPVFREGTVTEMILSIRDITVQAQKEEEIRKRAFFDALTGLPNRALLMDRLQQALAAAARFRQGVGVLFLDLDHFKEVNDTLGHDAGDALLVEAGRRLSSLVRRNDTIARLGGDEFVIVISELTAPGQPAVVAAKVLDAFRLPFFFQGQPFPVGVSIGIATAPEDGTDGAALLKRADTAMYQAKRGGRSGYRCYSEELPG
ncbi:MAG: diguanylate cyclase [Holophaga sp.]|nr:diguanylate cyclase [Holophaga sp.]